MKPKAKAKAKAKERAKVVAPTMLLLLRRCRQVPRKLSLKGRVGEVA